jgi:hypothetical protein
MPTVDYTFTCENADCGVTITKAWRQTSEPKPQYCSLPCWYAVRKRKPYVWRKYTFTETQDQQIREACRKHGQLKAQWKAGVFGQVPYPVLKYRAKCLGIVRTQPDELWTPEEDALLGEYGEGYSLERLARLLHRHGYHRSAGACRVRLFELGMSTRQGDWTLTDIAQGLDIDEHSVKRWVERGYLKAHATSGPDKPRWYVSSADMKRFLVRYPFVAAHGDSRISWLITLLSGHVALDRAAVGD